VILNNVEELKNTNNGVLFQNTDANINMGVWFDDPDITFDDLCWYNILATQINFSLNKNAGLISVDEHLQTKSCFAELHSHGHLNSTDC